MFKKTHKINILIVIAIFFYACNTARRVPPGKALLKENHITGVDRELKELLQEQIRQQPNRKILFTYKFFLAVYNTFDTSQRKTWIRKRMLRIGEQPVIYDSSLNSHSAQNIELTLFNMGYYDARVTWKDTLVGRKKNYAKVYYHVVKNKPYIISKLSYYISDRYLDSVVRTEIGNSYIKLNHTFNKSDFDAERNRITTQVRNLGYYYFNKEYIYFEIDSIVDSLKVRVKVIIENPEQFSEHKKYIISDVYINILNPNIYHKFDTIYSEFKGFKIKRNGYNIARNVLLTKIFIYKGAYYNQKNNLATYEHLNDLQLFRYINITYSVDTSHWVHTHRQDEFKGDYEFFGDTTGREPSLICLITLAPTSKYEFVVEPQAIISDQSGIGGQRNTNYGGAMSVLFRNKNILTKGETFQLSANGALAYQFDGSGKFLNKTITYRQFGVDAQLKIPKLILPGNLKFVDSRNANTILNVNYGYEFFQEFKREIFSTAYRYQATLFKLYTLNFSPIDISYIQSRIIDNEYEKRINSNTLTRIQFQPKLIVSLKLNGEFISKQLINNLPKYSVRVGLESAGWLLNKFSEALNAEYDPVKQAYKLFGVPYSQFYRADFELRFSRKSGPYSTVAFRFYAGTAIPALNSIYTGVPFEKRFFVGGTNDLRGWRIRKIGPGSYYYADTFDFYRAGDIKFMYNAEFRRVIYKALIGAVFLDAGNVWNYKPEIGKEGASFDALKFYKQFAYDAGIGLRYDFDFFVFRLDAAFPVFDPRDTPLVPDHWVLNHIHFDRFIKNMNYNIAIGLPF